ncbi:YcaO-like family protein [Salinirubrum litoreum]|uniref:YcaO-like family protein n=1 Tax=Salinirubrum litoreum TaxID=1126234 RepID=A0ABD5R8U9_9EURY|nr:YcaO-like family protein [Salinirubrum litoreum]
MNVGIAGSGPAVESLTAALADVDATVTETTPDELARFGLGAVVAPTGADAFRTANAVTDRWLAVEVGGVGGHPLPNVDAGVAVFDATADTTHAACFDCLRRRVAANAPETAERPRGDRSAVRFAGAVAGRRAVRLLAGESLGGTVVEVPGPERRVLPVPGCDCADRHVDDFQRYDPVPTTHRDAEIDDALARAEHAVDDRVGLVAQVGERESFPVPYYLAQLADTSGFSDASAPDLTAGVDADWNPAFMKALGEALERYCGAVYRQRGFTVAPEETRARPVSPRRFVRPDAGYRPPDAEEPIPWVDGVELDAEALSGGEAGGVETDGDEGAPTEVSVPAEFVHFPPPTERHKPSITTGLGLGNSGVEALLSGLYEVIERDATMLAWYSEFEPLALAIDDPGFETLVGRARAEELSVTPLLVTQDVDVPVVACAVHRDPETSEWPHFAVGSGADLDPASAARSALAEALQNWTELRAMGPEQASGESGAIGHYAGFPTPAREFVDAEATVPAASVGPDPVPTGRAELAGVVDRLTEAELDAYAVRLTTREVAGLGFEAVRAVVPEAQPLFTGDPFFGDRAHEVPRRLGFEPRLDRAFHPYP